MTTSNAAATAATGSSNNGYSSSGSTSALNQNYQTFLKLLTTQLKNQDPLNPQDSSQFTNQLVMFSQVEQQINTNTTLNTMLTNQETGLTTDAVNYIGKTIAGTGNRFSFDGSSNVNLGYTLASAAASSTVTITNSGGVVVYDQKGATDIGAHSFTWNGQDSSGNALAAGNYTVAVTAADAQGKQVNTTAVVPGTVTSVTASGGTTYLTVDGQSIPLSQVDSVGAAPATSTTSK